MKNTHKMYIAMAVTMVSAALNPMFLNKNITVKPSILIGVEIFIFLLAWFYVGRYFEKSYNED